MAAAAAITAAVQMLQQPMFSSDVLGSVGVLQLQAEEDQQRVTTEKEPYRGGELRGEWSTFGPTTAAQWPCSVSVGVTSN